MGQSRTHLTCLVTPKGSADFFDISMRLVLCLPKDIPKSKKYWAERQPFFSFLSLYVCLYFLLNLCVPGVIWEVILLILAVRTPI